MNFKNKLSTYKIFFFKKSLKKLFESFYFFSHSIHKRNTMTTKYSSLSRIDFQSEKVHFFFNNLFQYYMITDRLRLI